MTVFVVQKKKLASLVLFTITPAVFVFSFCDLSMKETTNALWTVDDGYTNYGFEERKV